MKRSTQWLLLLSALLVLAVLLGGYLYTSFQETEKLERDRLVHQVDITQRNLAQQLQTTSNALQAIRDDLPELLKLPPAPNPRLQIAATTTFVVRAC